MPTINTGQDKQKGVQNFLKALTNMGDILSQETKLKTQLLANQYEKKQNFLFKIQERLQENQMTQDMMNKMNAQGQGQGQGDNLPNENPYQLQPKVGGRLSIEQRSPQEIMKSIELGHKHLDAKEAQGFMLSTGEQSWRKKYPKDVWVKEKKEVDKNKITPSQALNIISDPFKSQQLKKYYPDLYKKIEGIAKQEETKIIPEENLANQYTPEQEQIIQDNIKAYGRTREEVIQALAKRGLL